MSLVISVGWEIMDTLLAGNSIVLAPVRLARKYWKFGLMVRFCVDTA